MKKLCLLALFLFCAPVYADDLLVRITNAQNVLYKHPKLAGCGAKSVKCSSETFQDANTILAVSCADRPFKLVRLLSGQDRSGSYRVERGPRNGVNTRFTIVEPAQCTVLAIKRAVQAPDGVQETVYTPYSPVIDTPMMRGEGMRYLVNAVDRAQRELSRKRVISQAFPDKSVSGAVPTNVAVRLALIEHIEPVRAETEPIKNLMNEVLVIVAANGPSAYRYSVSSAGARGLYQVTPDTYAAIRKAYPRASLNASFVEGMQDHDNAAQATLLLFDLDMATLTKEKRHVLARDQKLQTEYLAAAYNGGSGRAEKAMDRNGGIVVHELLPETQGYIAKLRRVQKAL